MTDRRWSEPLDWLAQLDLDPASSSLRIGTRSLGARPWLVSDAAAVRELEQKAHLTRHSPGDVFAALEATTGAGQEVLDLIGAECGSPLPPVAGQHPLLTAGLRVQEDLCLLAKHQDGWRLVAASLHCPSRWRLADKIGRHMTHIHAPVAGYADTMARRVDGFLDALNPEPVLRRNWFIHADDVLFQPVAPSPRTVPAARCGQELTVRSERQTLRKVGEHILFTIRVQRCPVGELLSRRGDEFGTYLTAAPEAEQVRRGLRPKQVEALRQLLR